MKKENIENLNIFAKGFLISIVPFVIIQLETFFVKSYSVSFLMSGLYKIMLIGIVGLILSWVYIILKKKYRELSRKIIKGVVIIYYLLFLIYFIVIIYFQIQAPLFS